MSDDIAELLKPRDMRAWRAKMLPAATAVPVKEILHRRQKTAEQARAIEECHAHVNARKLAAQVAVARPARFVAKYSRDIRSDDGRIMVSGIVAYVADYFDLSVEDILSHRRPKKVATPRHIAMYLARELTLCSLPEIGRRIGGRDHTTALYGIRRAERLKESDRQIAADIQAIRDLIVPPCDPNQLVFPFFLEAAE